MTIEYIKREDGGEGVPCDSCSMAAPTAEFDWGPPYTEQHANPKRLLCQFCACTMAGSVTRYLARDSEGYLRSETWKAAASVYNMLKFPELQ
jgi:hypothetical protein